MVSYFYDEQSHFVSGHAAKSIVSTDPGLQAIAGRFVTMVTVQHDLIVISLCDLRLLP